MKRSCHRSKLTVVVFASAMTQALVGCGVDSESITTLKQVALLHENAGNRLDADSETSASNHSRSSIPFTPPFPDRANPFHTKPIDDVEIRTPTNAANIQVMGFAKLDQQQAILRIGDDTQFVIQGDRIGEIEVLEINPPRVKMRSGNLTWEASMFH